MTDETNDTTDATSERFAAILADLELDLTITPAWSNTYGERDECVYFFVLQGGPASIEGRWACGSAVPLTDEALARALRKRPNRWMRKDFRQPGIGGRLSIDAAENRAAVRREFRPSLSDIVGALLLDDSTTEGYPDWIDYAEEFGLLAGDHDADALRKAREDHATIQRRAPLLRRMLGDAFETLRALAAEM